MDAFGLDVCNYNVGYKLVNLFRPCQGSHRTAIGLHQVL